MYSPLAPIRVRQQRLQPTCSELSLRRRQLVCRGRRLVRQPRRQHPPLARQIWDRRPLRSGQRLAQRYPRRPPQLVSARRHRRRRPQLTEPKRNWLVRRPPAKRQPHRHPAQRTLRTHTYKLAASSPLLRDPSKQSSRPLRGRSSLPSLRRHIGQPARQLCSKPSMRVPTVSLHRWLQPLLRLQLVRRGPLIRS